ncbi:zinc finger BED domain-containing protein RICESLEEPER 2-like [Phoenix dactylifera]|uniref:Zinc finger BED domain-containing protein RICESLEEPER 2-like n=1 Tax=Phoenix dactylifera TaxID=42345 RepID=A0A8B8IZE6_PHODC|nr:zinc finger BED domain-containing protein RICESLEEPER 2-like [Phoenix dactylifera]
MATSLKIRLFANKSLLHGGDFFQIRCCCHIINLIVQAGLNLIDGVICKIRNVAKHLKNSIPKKKKFYEIAEKSFHLNTRKRLRSDCCVRWNSTFLMLDRAVYFKAVLDHWGQRDREFGIFALSEEEWEKVANLHKFLKVFYDVTNQFSASKHPIANIYFRRVWEIHRKLIETANGPYDFMVDMVRERQVKFNKYWSEYSLILSCATVLDPRCKLELVEYCYSKLYGKISARKMVQNIKNTLYDLFEEYMLRSTSVSSPKIGTSSGSDVGNHDADSFEDYELFLSKK